MAIPTVHPPSEEHLGTWEPWKPEELASRLHHVEIPWCVAGGWALDLWRGEQTRLHEDIEIAVPRACFDQMRSALSGFRLFCVGDGHVRALHGAEAPPQDRHQVWVLDEAANAWRLDIFLEPGDANVWAFRRDETIRVPRSQIVATSARGVPYLKPEAVLLFKAKLMREKDEADFEACVPLMQPAERAWLKHALRVAHPEHAWIAKLSI